MSRPPVGSVMTEAASLCAARRLPTSVRSVMLHATALRRVLRTSCLLCTLIATGCDGSTTEPRRATQLSIAPSKSSVEVGDTVRLTAAPRDADDRSVSGVLIAWHSTDPTVASVDSSGLVRGLRKGSSTIRATAEGLEALAGISVALTPVATVVIRYPSLVIGIGGTGQLSAQAYDAHGRALGPRATTWRTRDSTVASVSDAGLVTGRALGTTSIVAVVEGVEDSASIRVDTMRTGEVRVRIGRLWWYIDIGQCTTDDTLWLNVVRENGMLRASTSEIHVFCGIIFSWANKYDFPPANVEVTSEDGIRIQLQLTSRVTKPGSMAATLTLKGDLTSGGVARLETNPRSPTKNSGFAGGWSVLPP